MAITLTARQRAVLNGEKGAVAAKVLRTLIMYGETFGAEKLVPVTGARGHLVTSFGLGVMKAVYKLMDELIGGGALAGQQFTVDPRPLDPRVPASLLQKLFFRVMYSRQADYEAQLKKLGLIGEDGFTCTCYMNEVGNVPKRGDVLSWAESSAVVYANSVLGARCNRNSGIIELFGSIAGWVPFFGLLTDDGRRASWIVEVRTTGRPEAQLLGSAIGMKVTEDVPFIRGLDRWLGTALTQEAKDYLKDMGAAAASNGAVGLYHVENLTPEAVSSGRELILRGAKTYVIDDAELERVRQGYPCIWKNVDARPKLCFVGCPHLSTEQLERWSGRLFELLERAGRKKVVIPTVFTAAPAVAAAFRGTGAGRALEKAGVVVSDICPLMYMNNPLCGRMAVITNSNKLRTYTTSRYYTDDGILGKISGTETLRDETGAAK
jgi:predicted aconitase